MKKMLIGTIGYHNLRNHSIAPLLLPILQSSPWPAGVEVTEMNWGAIAIVQNFQSLPAPYERVILLAAMERPGRNVGDITVFQWQGRLPDEELIQRCVGDAVTGVISVDNLLVIGEYFKIWPAETFVIDVEPGPESAGEGLSEEMQEAVPELLQILQNLVQANGKEHFKSTPLYGDTLIEV